MSKPDGGPAFPIPAHGVNSDGMTLRDYFAGQALQGMIASHGLAHSAWNTAAPDANASLAYQIADAMLAARDA